MRRVTGLVFLTGALMIAAILVVIILPTWVRPGWLLPLMIAVIVLFVASVFGSVALIRANPQRGARAMATRARRGDFSLAPRGVVITIAMLAYFAAFIAIIVVGQQVIAARALGAHPARTVAITTDDGNCSRCAPDATFAVGNREYRASLSGNIDGGLHPGVALVYDPSDPYRVMTLADWQSGRTGSAPIVLLSAPILVILTTAGLWGLADLRRRRFGTLRPSTSIESVRSAAAARRRRTTRIWSVRFDDGTRARYTDSPRLRAALSGRLTTATPGTAISADDRVLLTPLGHPPSPSVYPAAAPTPLGYSPFPYQPTGYPPSSYPSVKNQQAFAPPTYPPASNPQPGYLSYPGYSPYPLGFGAHEAPSPPRTRTRDRVIMLVSLALATIGVVTALVVGLHHSNTTASGGGVAGTVAAGNGDPATDDDCLDGPTLGPSPAATAYLNAVAAAMPEWLRVDATLAAQGGVIHARDIAGELSADTTFVDQLRPIQFPATLAATGQQLIAAIQGYDSLLTSAENREGYLTAHRGQETQLLQQRSQASGQLRQVLGLPPSHCTLLRP